MHNSESILSLLVKILNRKNKNSLIDFHETISESRVGDGAYFISNVLKIASKLSNECREVIKMLIQIEITKNANETGFQASK